MSREKRKFLPKKRSNSKLVNFLAFISGMVTTLMGLLLVWGYVSPPPQPVRTTPRSIITPQASNSLPISLEDLDGERVNITADQMEELLNRLNDWNRKAEVAVRVSQNMDRVKVADRLLQMPLSEEQRYFAVESKLNALTTLYGLDYVSSFDLPESASSLREFALEHKDSINQGIGLQCELALLKVDAFESAQQGNPDELKKIVHHMADLLSRYPDSKFVVSTIDLIIKALYKEDSNNATKLRLELIAHTDQFGTEKFGTAFNREFIRSQADLVKLGDLQIEQLFENRWIDGEPGIKKLIAATQQLAADEQGGELVLRQVAKVLNWLEQTDQYDQCRRIYQTVMDSVDDRETESTRDKALAIAKNGLARCDLIGKIMEINGNLISGDRLDPNDLKGKIVVMLFWSEAHPESFNEIKEFHADSKNLSDRPIHVLAVCVDEQAGDQLTVRSGEIPDFQIVVLSGSQQQNSIVDQYPVDQVPNSLIVNRSGQVVDINIPFDELLTSVKLVQMEQAVSTGENSSSSSQPPVDQAAENDQSADDQ